MFCIRLSVDCSFASCTVSASFFTYESDSQESDIEILTAFYNTSNQYVRPGLQLTNQNNYGNHSQNTHSAVPYPADPTAGEHEVRVPLLSL